MIMMTSYFHNLFSFLGEPDSDITCKELSSGDGMNLMENIVLLLKNGVQEENWLRVPHLIKFLYKVDGF